MVSPRGKMTTKIHPIIIGFLIFILISIATMILLPFPYPLLVGLVVSIIVALMWRKKSLKDNSSLSNSVGVTDDPVYCKKCGNKLDSKNNFCTKCGDKR